MGWPKGKKRGPRKKAAASAAADGAAVAVATSAPTDMEVVYVFTHAKRSERCVRCRGYIRKYDLHARSTNGKRRICCACWDGRKNDQ